MGKKIKVTQEQLDRLKEQNTTKDIRVDVVDNFQDMLDNIAEKIDSEDASISPMHNIEIQENGTVEFSVLFSFDYELNNLETIKEKIEEEFNNIKLDKNIMVDLSNSKNRASESFIKVDFN